MSRVTIDDVAARTGLSTATVSKAMRGIRVADETRERILAAARELGWTPNPHASSLASGRTGVIGLVMVFYGLWFDGRMLKALNDAAAAADQDLLVWTTRTLIEPQGRSGGIHSVTRRVDGLLLVDFDGIPEHATALREIAIPTVTIGGAVAPFPSISIDNRAAAQQAVDHLIGLGHRRVAIVCGPASPREHSQVSEARLAGYHRALDRAGIPRLPELEIVTGLDLAGGTAAFARLRTVAEGTRPTAVFCCSDEIAVGLLLAATHAGVDVPGALSIIGFDDHDLAALLGLTTIRQPIDALATGGLAQVVAIVNGAPTGPTTRTLPVELVRRTSTAPPR
jgi:DNA-binding LacI/PurR family transcriptional regulator